MDHQWDVSIACVNDVIAFISLLGASSRIKSYVDTLPKPIIITKSYDLIVDELIQKNCTIKHYFRKVSSLASYTLLFRNCQMMNLSGFQHLSGH